MGHLEVLVFLRQQNCAWDQRVLKYALLNGHEDVALLKSFFFHDKNDLRLWAVEHGCPLVENDSLYAIDTLDALRQKVIFHLNQD